MKKIIILFAVLGLLGLFGSCAFMPDYTWMPPAEIDTLEKAQELIQSMDRIASVGLGSWQTPRTTYTIMSGDCNDFSGLLAAIMIYNLHYNDVQMVGCISRSSMTPHMVVFANGKYYESYTGRELKKFYDVYIKTNSMSYQRYCKYAKLI